jgi:hypothetical protein
MQIHKVRSITTVWRNIAIVSVRFQHSLNYFELNTLASFWNYCYEKKYVHYALDCSPASALTTTRSYPVILFSAHPPPTTACVLPTVRECGVIFSIRWASEFCFSPSFARMLSAYTLFALLSLFRSFLLQMFDRVPTPLLSRSPCAAGEREQQGSSTHTHTHITYW